MWNLVELPKEDIVLLGDGDGNTVAVKGQRLTAPLKPIYGRENVSRLLLATLPKIHHLPGFSREIGIVNGLPTIISYANDMPVAVISIEPDGDQIRNIYIQNNPEKLKRRGLRFGVKSWRSVKDATSNNFKPQPHIQTSPKESGVLRTNLKLQTSHPLVSVIITFPALLYTQSFFMAFLA